MKVGNVAQIASAAIRAANGAFGTSIPVLSGEQIGYLMNVGSYLKTASGVGVNKIRNTVDNFRNRPQGTGLDDSGSDNVKQEQKQKRKLWKEQQRARLSKNNLSEDIKTKGQHSKSGINPEKAGEGSQSRTPRAIAARLRAFQEKERDIKQKQGIDGQVQKIKNIKETTERLKNIYRIINGASAASFFGIIITFFVMNLQLLVGNLLGSKLVPKLSLFEIIIIVFLDLLLLFIVIMLILLIYAMANPCEVVKVMPMWKPAADILGATCDVVEKVKNVVK